MQMSEAGRLMLQALEGVRATPYRDVAGLETTGCGHLCTDDEQRTGVLAIGGVAVPYRTRALTAREVDQLLAQDLALAERALEDAVTVPLEQHQFDALASWVFNVGITAMRRSTLLAKLNAGELDAVTDELRRWNRAGGQVVAGLTARRERECACWEGRDTT